MIHIYISFVNTLFLLYNTSMRKLNPLLAFAINQLLPQTPGQALPAGELELADTPCVELLRRKDGSVTIIIGRRESGKTVLGYRLAELLGRPVYAVSPEQKPPTGVTRIDIEELDTEPPPNSTLFLDDIPVYASQRDYGVAAVRVLEKLIPVVRHDRKLHIISATQSSGLSDKFILDADMVLLKPANLLFGDLERPAVSRFYREVQPLFDEMSEYAQKRYVYVLTQGWRGMVRVLKPEFM